MKTISNTSINELAGDRGISNFDTSLPQDWLDAVVKYVHWPSIPDATSPYGHIVWCYDHSLMGHPRAIDYIGDMILGQYASIVRR